MTGQDPGPSVFDFPVKGNMADKKGRRKSISDALTFWLLNPKHAMSQMQGSGGIMDQTNLRFFTKEKAFCSTSRLVYNIMESSIAVHRLQRRRLTFRYKQKRKGPNESKKNRRLKKEGKNKLSNE